MQLVGSEKDSEWIRCNWTSTWKPRHLLINTERNFNLALHAHLQHLAADIFEFTKPNIAEIEQSSSYQITKNAAVFFFRTKMSVKTGKFRFKVLVVDPFAATQDLLLLSAEHEMDI